MSIENMKWDLVALRKVWFSLSAIIIIIGLIFMIRNIATDDEFRSPLRLGIDFAGGEILQLRFVADTADLDAIGSESIYRMVDEVTEKSPSIQISEEAHAKVVFIRADPSLIDSANQNKLYESLKTEIGQFEIEEQQTITPVISHELLTLALRGLIIGAILVLAYVAIRMSIDFALFAVVALIHDLLILTGIFAMFQVEINSYFVAAALTVVGYSVNDTIVIYDRIRENSKIYRAHPFDRVVNFSLLQTLTRSINTSLTTLFTVLALYFFGGASIKDFTFALAIGVVAGSYSSIFTAAQLLVSYRLYKAKGRMVSAEETLTEAEKDEVSSLDEADTEITRQAPSTAARKKRKRRY